MSALRTPHLRFRYTDSNGNPLSAGRVYTYAAGSTTPAPTYLDELQTAQNTNPVILDAAGEARIFLNFGDGYKFVVKDSDDATIITEDNVYGVVTGANVNDIALLISGQNVPPNNGGGTPSTPGPVIVSGSVWISLAQPPAYTGSNTVISVSGDQTGVFPVGSRLRFSTASSTGYGTVTAAVFTNPSTTVTVVQDSIPFDNTVTSVAYSTLNYATTPIDAGAVRFTPTLTYPDMNTVGYQLKAVQAAIDALPEGGGGSTTTIDNTPKRSVTSNLVTAVPTTTTGHGGSSFRLIMNGPRLVMTTPVAGRLQVSFDGFLNFDVITTGAHGVLAPYYDYMADVTASIEVTKDDTGLVTTQPIFTRRAMQFGGRQLNAIEASVSGVFDPTLLATPNTGYRTALVLSVNFFNTSSVPSLTGTATVAGTPAPFFVPSGLTGQFAIVEI